MLPERVFLYKARRSYLYGNSSGHTKGRLDPPPEFQNKRQTHRHRHAEENKSKISSSAAMRNVSWAKVKEMDYNEIINRNFAREDAAKGFQPKGRAARANNKITTLPQEEPFILGEWEKLFEAGVHFWLNRRTGECRSEISSVMRLASDAHARRSSVKPGTATTLMDMLNSKKDRLSGSSSPNGGTSHQTPQVPECYGTGWLVYKGNEMKDLLNYLDGLAGEDEDDQAE